MGPGTWADWFAAAGTILASGTAIVLAMRGRHDQRHELADQLMVRVTRRPMPVGVTTTLDVNYSTPPNVLFYSLQLHWYELATKDAPSGWKSRRINDAVVGNQALGNQVAAGHVSRKHPVYVSFQDAHGRQFVRDTAKHRYISPEKLEKLSNASIALP